MSTKSDNKVFAQIARKQQVSGCKVMEWRFKRKQVQAFRYSMEDAPVQYVTSINLGADYIHA